MKEKIGIFINCHSSYGGAERRFYRAFSMLKNHENIYLIANNRTIENLSANDSDEESVSKDKFIIMPGGIKKSGLAYKSWHLINSLLLVFYVIKQKIRHIHYPVDPSFYTLFHYFILTRLGISYSVSVVDSSRTSLSDFSKIRYFVWRITLKNADRIDYLSESIKDSINRLFPSLCGSSSVSPCSFTNYERAIFSKDKIYDLVMLSRFVSKKGHVYLIDGLKALASEGVVGRLQVGLFGDGPDLNYIKDITNGIEDFDFHFGQIDDVFEILSKSRILLSLQRDENYPSQAVLEAYASGAICILTDVGESYKLVPEKGGGFLVPRDDPTALASCIKLAIHRSKSIDPLIQYHIARKFVRERHSIEVFNEYLTDFLSRCLR